ncbi:hypothetical protein [Actinomadura sp. DC4]|uniref:hypothetical protein n=1 Tax=Actinomadura sp. DC4 TaxID=3055069 RepID=UPI0025B1D23B|nr:hypothetical protein [Actinomadura sp. DC4]MDN3356100.1 hypothetical protein [Actinomadura sp. DC4]
MDPLTPRWPDGQLDRYLTLAGAMVDLTAGPGDYATVKCLGCRHTDVIRYHSGPRGAASNARLGRGRAYDHASRCRTIAPPDGDAPSTT